MADSTPPSTPGPSSTGPSGDGARKAEPGYEPSPEDKEIINLVQQRVSYTTREPARWAVERQQFENIAFYNGIQWIEYSETTRRFTKFNAPTWFPTPIQNEIAPRVTAMTSRLLRSKPEARVAPSSNDPKDREGAKVGDKLMTHINSVAREEEIRQDAAIIAATMGTVVAEEFFNPRAGTTVRMPRTQLQTQQATEPAAQCPTCGQQADFQAVGMPCPQCATPMEQGERPAFFSDGQPKITAQSVPQTGEDGQPIEDVFPQGEIETNVRMTFNFYHDPKATDLRKAQWCGEGLYVDLDWLDTNYPEMGKFVSEESGVDAANFYEANLLALIGPSIQGTAYYGGASFYRGGVVLRKYQEKPSAKRPRGLFAIVANGVLLYKGDLPIQDQNGVPTGDFSWTEFRYDLVPGRFLGRTPVDDMVPLQRQVNGTMSQIILNRKTLLNPWVMAPKGSGLAPGAVACRPGATVLYNFVGVGAAPQIVPGQPLPAQVTEERNDAIAAMDRMAQGGEATQAPPGMKSAVAFAHIRERDDEASEPRLQRWGQWIADRGRKRLLLAAKHYREPRAVKIMGDGTEWMVRMWMGADIQGQTDVMVLPGTVMPRSQAARTQLMLDGIEAQLIDLQDPFQKQKAIEEIGLIDFETPIGPDRRRALKENATMDMGQPTDITPVDDHATHLHEHEWVMKDPAYDSKPELVRQLYLMHWQAHKQAQAMEQMQQQAAAQGETPLENGGMQGETSMQ